MDSYLQSIKFTSMLEQYRHKEFGLVLETDEPLSSVLKQCTQHAFEGKSFQLGSIKLSDTKVLTQISRDYSEYLLQSIMVGQVKSKSKYRQVLKGFDTNERGYRDVKRMAFESDARNSRPLTDILRTIKNKNDCVKVQGWWQVRNKQVLK